jgi:hypothetical protein
MIGVPEQVTYASTQGFPGSGSHCPPFLTVSSGYYVYVEVRDVYLLEIITCDSLIEPGIPGYSLLRTEHDKLLSVPLPNGAVFADWRSDQIEHAKLFGREQIAPV